MEIKLLFKIPLDRWPNPSHWGFVFSKAITLPGDPGDKKQAHMTGNRLRSYVRRVEDEDWFDIEQLYELESLLKQLHEESLARREALNEESTKIANASTGVYDYFIEENESFIEHNLVPIMRYLSHFIQEAKAIGLERNAV